MAKQTRAGCSTNHCTMVGITIKSNLTATEIYYL